MDLKAKAPVQSFKDCNSFYGCSFCILKGISGGNNKQKEFNIYIDGRKTKVKK